MCPRKGNKKDQDSQILFLMYNTWTKSMVYTFLCHQHSTVGFIPRAQGSNRPMPHYWIIKKGVKLWCDSKCLPPKAAYVVGCACGKTTYQSPLPDSTDLGVLLHRVQPLTFYQGSMVTLGYGTIKIVYFSWFIHEQIGKIKIHANTGFEKHEIQYNSPI